VVEQAGALCCVCVQERKGGGGGERETKREKGREGGRKRGRERKGGGWQHGLITEHLSDNFKIGPRLETGRRV
jgi:hypothetical protein